MDLELDQFRDVDLVIDKANDNFIQRQFVSQGDYKGRTLTVQVTDNGVIGEIPGLVLNLRWQNQASGLTDLSAFTVLDKANSIFRLEYPAHMMTPGKVVANIQIIQNGKTTHMKPFELTVQQLVGEAKGIVEKAEFSALVAVLSDANKFRTDIDSLVVAKADKQTVDRSLNEINDKINNFPKGNPSGVYATLTELKNKYPNGNSNIYVVTGTGNWYYWSGTDWLSGGKYQETGIADFSVTTSKASRLVQSGVFTSSQPIVIEWSTGKVEIPAGNFISGKYRAEVAAHTIVLNKDASAAIYFDTINATFFGVAYGDMYTVGQSNISFGAIQFPQKTAKLNGNWIAGSVSNYVMPINFLTPEINISTRNFGVNLNGQSSVLDIPTGFLKVGNETYTFKENQEVFDLDTEATVHFICFDTKSRNFYILSSLQLPQLGAFSVVLGNFNSTTFATNFPTRLIINGRAQKNPEIAGTTAFLNTIEGSIDISFRKRSVTIPPRTALYYYAGYLGSAETTGGVAVEIPFPTDSSEILLVFDIPAKKFRWYTTSEISKLTADTVYLLYLSVNGKKVVTALDYTIEGQTVIDKSVTRYEILENTESVGTTKNVRLNIDTAAETVTVFNFDAKATSDEEFSASFYHDTTLVLKLVIKNKNYKPFSLKIPAPKKGTSKLIFSGPGEVKNAIGTNTTPPIANDSGFLFGSHRGSDLFAPENTMEAFRYAKAQGYRCVETDINRTSDGVFVLLHDDLIDRTSNGTGSVKDFTYEELLEFDFSKQYADFENVKIPTLEEFLVFCKLSGIKPFLELKNDVLTDENKSEFVELVKKCGMWDNCFINSFILSQIEKVADADSNAPIGYVTLPTKEAIDHMKTLSPKSFISVYGWDTNDFASYEPFADLCLENNIPFTGSTSNLEVLKKVIQKGAFASVSSDVELSGCFW